MATFGFKVISIVAEFVSRFFPISKDETTLLGELGRPYRPDS